MQQLRSELKPFLSILLLIATLFSSVIMKMEARRMGYLVLKSTKEAQQLKDQNRLLAMEYAHLVRPEHVRNYAMSRLTLNDARNGQIIQLTGQRVELPR